MNTDELLEKIKKLFESEREHTKSLLEAEREHTKQLIEASEERVTKKIDELTEDMGTSFNKTWVKMDETNERVSIIEDHVGLPHPTEN